MDNEFGIVGYCKQNENGETISSIIFSSLALFFMCSLSTTVLCWWTKANIFYYITDYVIIFMTCAIFALIEIKNNQNNNNDYLYIYFKDIGYKQKFLFSRYCFKESVNFILENNIKPIDNGNYNFTCFTIFEDRIDLYNKLKNQYEIINF